MIAAIIVTGSREYQSYNTVARALTIAVSNLQEQGFDEIVIRHGDCKTGADAFAKEFYNKSERSLFGYGITLRLKPYKALWYATGKLDRSAGPRRNKEMVNDGANICLAFFQPGAVNKGTQGTVDLATAAGIPVIKY